MKREFPTDEDEILELARKMIDGMTGNPDFPSPPVPILKLQRMVDKCVDARRAEAVAKEAEKQAAKETQAALERLRSANRSLQDDDRNDAAHGNDTKLLASGGVGLADHFFLSFPAGAIH
jgi:hypothetical protein